MNTTTAQIEAIAQADGFTIERLETLDAYSRASIVEYEMIEINKDDYLSGLDDAVGSTPTPRPAPWTPAYREGYEEGRRLHLESCL